ncbi:MAG: hypothetical protein IK066_03370, partial [Kiritimatiellae bacterium]|nr:hypothetical protein [Kiritimatiellia bacterium]
TTATPPCVADCGAETGATEMVSFDFMVIPCGFGCCCRRHHSRKPFGFPFSTSHPIYQQTTPYGVKNRHVLILSFAETRAK